MTSNEDDDDDAHDDDYDNDTDEHYDVTLHGETTGGVTVTTMTTMKTVGNLLTTRSIDPVQNAQSKMPHCHSCGP